MEQLQKQIVTITGALEREKTANAAGTISRAHDVREANLGAKEQALTHRDMQFQQKADYNGKLAMAHEQIRQHKMANEGKDLEAKKTAVDHSEREASMQQIHRKTLNDQQQSTETKQAEATDKSAQVLDALAKGQQAMMEALTQIAKIVSADRESELSVGPDGKKKARSRVVMQ
jgi:hydroxylamine reductase (hybrid-cluster protein)